MFNVSNLPYLVVFCSVPPVQYLVYNDYCILLTVSGICVFSVPPTLYVSLVCIE